MKNFFAAGLILVSIFGVAGCNISFQRWQFRTANKMAANKEHKMAVDLYSRVMKRAPTQPLAIEAARMGARLASYEVKDYAKAVEFYSHIVLYSPDPSERLTAQKSLTEIQFEKLMNYDQALIELNHLIPLLPPKERAPYQLQVAHSYFNLNNSSQALIEVDELLSKRISSDLRFEALVFKGNLLQAAKRLDEAIKVFTGLRKDFESRAAAENIGMSLAICYEEKSDLKSAIEVLEDMKKHHANPDFIQIRIARLKERLANLPGAQGFKR
ncbi:MAG: tetratricopeptide repeat protein [Bdellovibrionales bacterium]